VAKKSGIFVKTFSVGFGRKILKKRYGETVYAISLLPFGGYVKFAGESEEGEESQKEAPQGNVSDEIPDSEIDPSRYFINKRPLIRSAVVFAGPFANYLLAIVLSIGMLVVHGLPVSPTTRLGVIAPGSVADSVGLRVNDVIKAVDGVDAADWDALVDLLLEDREAVRTFTLQRGAEVLDVDYKCRLEDNRIALGFSPYVSNRLGKVKRDGPAYRAGMRPGVTIDAINDTLINGFHDIERIIHSNPEESLVVAWTDTVQHVDTILTEAKKELKEGSETEFKIVGQIGVGPKYERESVPLHLAVTMGFNSSNYMVVKILSFLKLFFTGQVGIDAVGGPILITQLAGDMARWGFEYLIYFLSFFSINLCIFNLLPILPFDGGHLVMFLYEGIARRRVHPRLREKLAQGGFVLLILLMAFVVMVDLSRCFGSSPSPF
jgi:regulator of sigma E protease